MDFGKMKPVFGWIQLNFNQTPGLVLAKAYISAGFLGYAKNHKLQAHSVILILRNILAILDPLVLSVHFRFTFGLPKPPISDETEIQ